MNVEIYYLASNRRQCLKIFQYGLVPTHVLHRHIYVYRILKCDVKQDNDIISEIIIKSTKGGFMVGF